MAGGPDVAGLIEDDAVSVITEGLVVCDICGSGSAPHLIANCARCNAREHGTCGDQLVDMLCKDVWIVVTSEW
uniref:Uncharacterized protein n=1 Tax=Zea mays TaxID=4577 RepID=B6U8B8_MAIZE|nr:hypothetical protein [Zea mays]